MNERPDEQAAQGTDSKADAPGFRMMSLWPAVLLVAVVYVATLLVMPPDGFWVTDDANKFIQLQTILRSSDIDFSIPVPGRAVDPAFEFSPMWVPFSRVVDGKLYSVFSPFFSLVSLPFFKVFGYWGLYILPLVSGILLAAGMGVLARSLALSRPAQAGTVLVTGLCTPVWFYSVLFWEHTVAANLCVWSVVFLLRHMEDRSATTLAAGAVLQALGIYFRDELYLFAGVAVLALAWKLKGQRVRTVAIYAMALCVAMLPFWIFQWKTIGAPFGHHLAVHAGSVGGIQDYLSTRLLVVYRLLIGCNPDWRWSLLLASPFAAAFLVPVNRGSRASRVLIPVLCVLALAASITWLVWLESAGRVIPYLHNSANNTFVVAPILLLGCLLFGSGLTAERAGWLRVLIITYVVLYCLAAPELGSNGVHWGNRFLLIVYPFLALAAVAATEGLVRSTGQKAWLCIAPLLLMSLVLQLASLEILREKKRFSVRLNREVAALRQDVIVAEQVWTPQEMWSVFLQKKLFHAHSPEQLAKLVEKLAGQGYTEFVYAAREGGGITAAPLSEVSDGRLGRFGVRLFECSTATK